jgi:hypothetical protein
MKVHIRFDDSNELHTRFTLFLNGASCGQLCTRTDEAFNLHQIISMGCKKGVDDFSSSGHVYGGRKMLSEFTDSLRAIAQWYDEHPEVKPMEDLITFTDYRDPANKEEAAAIAKALVPFTKKFSANYITLTRDFGACHLKFVWNREVVCEKRVTGKKWVEERYIPGTFVAAHEEEVVEWDCKPLLADDQLDNAGTSQSTKGDSAAAP